MVPKAKSAKLAAVKNSALEMKELINQVQHTLEH
jgi:hypothetical protein